jgi:hypothetical protein
VGTIKYGRVRAAMKVEMQSETPNTSHGIA